MPQCEKKTQKHILCITYYMSFFSLLSVLSYFMQLSRQLVPVANNLSASPGHPLEGGSTVHTSRQWRIKGRGPPPLFLDQTKKIF